MHRGYRFRLYPTEAQAETLGQWVGVTRLVYNLALEQRRDFWRQYRASEGRPISYASQCKELTDLRAEVDWIRDVPRHGQEAALKDLDRAFLRFFRGGGFPTTRKMGLNDSTRLRGPDTPVSTLNAKWGMVRLPKLGLVRFRMSRPVPGDILTTTIMRTGGAWFVTFACDVGTAAPANSLPAVGIDRGVATTLALSDGSSIHLPSFAALEKRRIRAQRVLSRRKRGSKRYAHQRKALRRIAAKIARARHHHLHQASASIVARYGVVALEKLNVKAMTASAKGTVEEPGRAVAQKAGLNRSILAQGWSIFASQLEYKLEAAGGRLVYVPAAYTSQTCAECGVVDARSRKSQAVFECVACGHADHADTNAARNIMRGSTAFVEEGRHLKPSDEAITLAA